MKTPKNQYAFYFSDLSPHLSLDGKLAFQMERVLRLKTGSQVLLMDGKGSHGLYHIQNIENGSVNLELIDKTSQEKSKPLILIQGILKKENTELVIQKATELGATHIWIFQAENSVAKLKNPKKFERWNKICTEAMEQSMNFFLPELEYFSSLQSVLDKLKDIEVSLILANADANIKITEVRFNSGLACIIGPEGGISQKESLLLRKNGAKEFFLAPSILRAETAAIAALAQCQLLA